MADIAAMAKAGLIDTHHEQAAVFMAEARGKLNRQPGVHDDSRAGFTNVLTGVASTYYSTTPFVLIPGSMDLDHKEKLDFKRRNVWIR